MKRSAPLLSLLLAGSFLLQVPALVWAEQLTLKEGTPVRLRVTQGISSKTNNEGDMIDFEVIEDVKTDDGKTILIKAGTAARGLVSQVEERGRMGKAGELNIQIDSTKAVDGTKVPLRANMNRDGKDKTGSVIALSLIVSPLFLLKRGKDAAIPAGSEIRSFVNNDVSVHLAPPVVTTPSADLQTGEAATPDYLKKYADDAPRQQGITTAGNDNLQQLETLARLRKQGVITEAEFQAKKKQLLGL